MRDKRWFFIVNSTAGRGKTGKKISKLVTSINEHKLDFEIELTKAPQHAIQLAKDAIKKGFHNIISVGGDGTLNEVVNGVMHSGKADEVNVGIIPAGGGNDFAANFKLTSNIDKGVDLLMKFNLRKIDVGKIEDKYFINALGIGFDARVAIVSNKIKYLNGLPRYLLAVIKALVSLKMVEAEIIMDTGKINNPFLLLSIGNGLSTGGGFLLTPEARVDDGLLDICLINKVNRRRVLSLLPAAIKGKHLKEPEVVIHQSRKIEVITKNSLPIYYDGELPILKDPLHFTVELLPKKLNLIC
ncbi:MAG: diacylglycerol kinase family lipid kinase [Candidatus Cloacimonetes bacterium]|jgi:diacylglycerol kinase (ATP)|nr:diacylglycerol kinase family lipid kinase [Candidatus Cloacimonadota bacterium]